MTYPKSLQHTYLVDVCDEDKDRYRFGFNGQGKVNEIAGIGNHNTAEFWEYDTRLGRRWNRDPVDKVWESDYATFSNNPLIFVDPMGNTDFFSIAGDKIGTDGVNNGVKLLVLKRQTEKSIANQMKKNNSATLDKKQLQNTHLVPSSETLKKFDEVFEKTRGGAAEYGLVAGLSKDEQQVSSNVYSGEAPSSNIPSINHTQGRREFMRDLKGSKGYTVHSHPNAIKMLTKSQDYTIAGANPSEADIDGSKGASFANVVLTLEAGTDISATDKKNADEANGKWIPRSDKSTETISIYNSSGSKYKENYSDYKKLVEKINNTPTTK